MSRALVIVANFSYSLIQWSTVGFRKTRVSEENSLRVILPSRSPLSHVLLSYHQMLLTPTDRLQGNLHRLRTWLRQNSNVTCVLQNKTVRRVGPAKGCVCRLLEAIRTLKSCSVRRRVHAWRMYLFSGNGDLEELNLHDLAAAAGTIAGAREIR